MLAIVAAQRVGDCEKYAVERGAIMISEIDQFCPRDETAAFDKVPRPLAALESSFAHVGTCFPRLKPVPSHLQVDECRPARVEIRPKAYARLL